jgi:hypothetical protein
MTDNYVTNPRRSRSRAEQTKRNLWGAAVLVLLAGVVCLSSAMILAAISPDGPAALPAATAAPVQAAKVTPKPTPAPATYAKLTVRQWLKIAKDPDAYAGKAYIVHGVVTQFDAATGRSTFRANVDGVTHKLAYDYPTNAIMESRGAIVDDLVEDDQFTARVQVVGGHTYSTALGGVTTAPMLAVHRLTRR